MELFDQIKDAASDFVLDRTETFDPYVDDLEKVEFIIDGKKKTFVGGQYGGVPFFVEAHELDTGRRLLVMNIPNSDKNIIQDNGRKTRGVRFDAYLLGSDVFTQKNAVIDAMETPGVRELVHPYFGRFPARGWNLRLSERATEKQYVKMEMTFVLEVDKVTEKRSQNSTAAISEAVENSYIQQKNAFEKAWAVTNATVDAADELVENALDSINEVRESVREVALFKEHLREVRENIRHLIAAPGDLFESIKSLVTFEADETDENIIVPPKKDTQGEAFSLSGYEYSSPNTFNGSASDKTITNNDAAMVSVVKGLSATFSASLVTDVDYASITEATSAIQNIIQSSDDAQLTALDAGAYYSSLNVQAAATAYVSEISQDLARIEEIELKFSVPVLPLAWTLYGTIEGYQDILARNEIKDPFFVPYDTILEVRTG